MKRLLTWIVWLALAGVGTYGVFLRLTAGEKLADYGSYVPWGLWVSAYIYFIGLSAGAFLLSALVYVFNVKKLEPIAPLALVVALASLLMALLTILFDLGQMGRFYYVYTRPRFSSMMAWMVWLYTAYFLLLIAELYFAVRGKLPAYARRKGVVGSVARLLTFGRTEDFDEAALRRDTMRLKVLGTIGVPLAIAFHGGVGALFGTVVAQELWHSPIYPILFLTGALLSGGALMTALYAFFWPTRDEAYYDLLRFLSRIVLGLVAIDVMLEWAEYSIPMWYGVGPEYEALRSVLFGEFWYVYWVFHILLGVALPVALLAWRPRSPAVVGGASALIAATFLAIRLNLVIPSLTNPQIEGLVNAYHDARLTFEYVPNAYEWSIIAFTVALGVAVVYVLSTLLPVLPRKGATS